MAGERATGETRITDNEKVTPSSVKIMGIINLTPDSFSGDGLLSKGVSDEQVLNYAQDLVEQGADIIDVGGESTRPGAKPVSIEEELNRTIPIIERLSKNIQIPISIDTYKPEVAHRALEKGAAIVNDISGLRDQRMIEVIASSSARVVIMHMKGTPQDMQINPTYDSLIDEIIEYLDRAIDRASEAGISRDRIIVDPGIGFGKTVEHNLEILRNLDKFKALRCQILVGPSRKSFIGRILNLPPQERVIGTVASLVVAAMNGADIVRVHDVKFAAQALRLVGAILKR